MNFLTKIFPEKSQKSGIIFIVDDDSFYTETLKKYIQESFPEITKIKIFPVGETCLIALNENPDVIIIDYFLDTKYYDAETGLDIIKQMRAKKAGVKIILLSSQKDIQIVREAVKKYNCSYVKKDEGAYSRIKEILNEI